MERYVWELTHGLMMHGCKVAVICEEVFGHPDRRIRVEKIEKKVSPKPRWKAMIRFREEVDYLISQKFDYEKIIVHSHERSINHQVTTFHGPPFSHLGRSWLYTLLDRLIPRHRAWLALERDELLNTSVQIVISVSKMIEDDLRYRYKTLNQKKTFVGWPGVYIQSLKNDLSDRHLGVEYKFLFVGKEWKRKGLEEAVGLVTHFRNVTREKATLDIIGPEPGQLPKRFFSEDWINVRGFQTEILWNNFDALIHLATKEPFGMVVAEARSHGVPVLLSDYVGAAEIPYGGVSRVGSGDSLDVKLSKLRFLIRNPNNRRQEVKWTWEDLVRLHLLEIYPCVEMGKGYCKSPRPLRSKNL